METSEAIKGILKHREAIHKQNQWNNPMALSDTMTKLATYNAYLADNIAELHYQATESSNVAYKKARDAENTIADSESIAKIESILHRKEYENIKYVYTSTGNLISVLQTRLRVIENQITREGN